MKYEHGWLIRFSAFFVISFKTMYNKTVNLQKRLEPSEMSSLLAADSNSANVWHFLLDQLIIFETFISGGSLLKIKNMTNS